MGWVPSLAVLPVLPSKRVQKFVETFLLPALVFGPPEGTFHALTYLLICLFIYGRICSNVCVREHVVDKQNNQNS